MPALPTIHKGDSGDAVVYCQQLLNGKGYHLTADGQFGSKTDNAVRQFQASENLVVDGWVGEQTWNRLQSANCPDAKPPESLLNDKINQLLDLIPADAPEVVRMTLTIACKDLGVMEQPDGSNDGPEGSRMHALVKHYNAYWWVLNSTANVNVVKGRGYPLESECAAPMAWCGMSCSNWIREGLGLAYWDYRAGYATKLAGHPFEQFFGGPDPVENWAKNRGSWVTDMASAPMPAGACWTINRSGSNSDPSSAPQAGHIGMCVCDMGDGTIVTIEGNVSNGVGTYTRKKSDLRGYTIWW